MTEDNALLHLRVELEKARTLRREADTAASVGLHGRAAGALYFAALHACRALLSKKGLDPRSHGGVRALISLHFVKTGEISAEVPRLLSDLQEAREGSDYMATYDLSSEEYRALVEATDLILCEVTRVTQGH